MTQMAFHQQTVKLLVKLDFCKFIYIQKGTKRDKKRLLKLVEKNGAIKNLI